MKKRDYLVLGIFVGVNLILAFIIYFVFNMQLFAPLVAAACITFYFLYFRNKPDNR